jgi:hypothetical protein
VRTHFPFIDIKLTINLISTFVSLITRDTKKLYINRIICYDEEIVYENVIEKFSRLNSNDYESDEENISFSFLIIL